MKNKLSSVLRKKLWFIPIIIIVIRLALIGVTIRPDLFGKNSWLTSVAVIVVLLVLVGVAVQAGLFSSQKQQRDDTQSILMDVGDGAAEQLAKVGLTLASVQTITISHLAIEHTGGLYAILGMRFQEHITNELTIYGPPGTQRMVDGMIAGLQPLVNCNKAMFAHLPIAAKRMVQAKVVEVAKDSTFTIGSLRITAAPSTHNGTDHADAAPAHVVSYRFDMPDTRSPLHTGDAGPNLNVERLAQKVNLLTCSTINH
jgi:ribonuclease BN (tRNA processing enzyme)